MIIRDLQYNCEGHMALALVKYKDLYYLVRGYQKAQMGVFRVGCSAASVLVCIAYVECAIRKGSPTFVGHMHLAALTC